MSTFTKLSINGEVREVAALYDGSGNDITKTYETITKVSEKETILSGRITSVQEALDALTTRVTATEAFDARITKNAEDIAGNAASIIALQNIDTGYRTELDSLIIGVNENKNAVEELDDYISGLNKTLTKLSNNFDEVQALVEDEAQGINALNTQADQNTENIAILSENLNRLQGEVNNKLSTSDFTPVQSKVSELESTIVEIQETISEKADSSAITSLQEQIASLIARIEVLENIDTTPEEEPEPEPDPDSAPEPEPEPEPDAEPEEGA